jgi:hypothetical protein
MVASSIMGVSNTVGMLIGALVGGAIGAVIFVLGYFVGVALIGAGMGTTIAHVVWGALRVTDPPWQLIVLASVAGALGAMALQRYVVIVGTAFAGSWTIILGGTALTGDRAAKAAAAADPWILYPLNPLPGARWIYAAWIGLASWHGRPAGVVPRRRNVELNHNSSVDGGAMTFERHVEVDWKGSVMEGGGYRQGRHWSVFAPGHVSIANRRTGRQDSPEN